MRGIMIHIRSSEDLEDSKNIFISMLEKLFSDMDVKEKRGY